MEFWGIMDCSVALRPHRPIGIVETVPSNVFS